MQGMFNDDAFSKIKKGARIINVARGGVIDDHALARALDAGQVAQVQLTLAAHFCTLIQLTCVLVLVDLCTVSSQLL